MHSEKKRFVRHTQNYWTVSMAVPVTPFILAEIVEVPAEAPLALPLAVTVAVAGLEEVQETWLVIPATEPSLNVPLAVNCCDPATLMVAFTGDDCGSFV